MQDFQAKTYRITLYTSHISKHDHGINSKLSKKETTLLLTPLKNQKSHVEDKQLFVHLAYEVKLLALDTTHCNKLYQ